MIRFELNQPGQRVISHALLPVPGSFPSSAQQTLLAPNRPDEVHFGSANNNSKASSSSRYLPMLTLLAGLTVPASPALAEAQAISKAPIETAVPASVSAQASQIKGRIATPNEVLDLLVKNPASIVGKIVLDSLPESNPNCLLKVKTKDQQFEHLILSGDEDVSGLISHAICQNKEIPEITDWKVRVPLQVWAGQELQQIEAQAALLDRVVHGFYQAKQDDPGKNIAELAAPWLNRLVEQGKVEKAVVDKENKKFEIFLKPVMPGGQPLTFKTPVSLEQLNLMKEKKVNIPNIDEITPGVLSQLSATIEDHAILTLVIAIALATYLQLRMSSGVKQAKTFQIIQPDKLTVDLEDVGGLPREFKRDLEKKIRRIRQENQNFSKQLQQMKTSKNPLTWATSRIPLLKTRLLKETPWTQADEKRFQETGQIDLKPSIPYTGDSKFQTLLVGEPGTGKTMLAKTIAKRLGVPFISISGGDFAEVYVGTGSKRVREVFKKAQQNAPCIVFIDEIEEIAMKRKYSADSTSRGQTQATLLSYMDGLNSAAGITVIAATNAPVEDLDPAVIRPGRFEVVNTPAPKTDAQRIDVLHKVLNSIEREILQKDPQWKGPLALLSSALSAGERAKYGPNQVVDVQKFAKIMAGESGATISGTIKAAVEMARDEGAKQINMAHVLQGYEKVKAGSPEPEILEDPANERMRELTAGHEGGHAIAALLWNKVVEMLELQNMSSVQKGKDPYEIAVFSMTPRSGSLGHVRYISNLGHKTLLDMIGSSIVGVGGRAAEEVMGGGDVLAVTKGGKGDWDQLREELISFIHSGAVRGSNTSTLKRDAHNQPEPTEEDRQLANRLTERYLWTMVNVLNVVGRERLKSMEQDALKLSENGKLGDLFLEDAGAFFEKHLEGVDWDTMVQIVNQESIIPTRKELLDARRKALTVVDGSGNKATAKRKALSKRGQPA